MLMENLEKNCILMNLTKEREKNYHKLNITSCYNINYSLTIGGSITKS